MTVAGEGPLATLPFRLLINGEWREAESGATFAVVNPANGTVLGSVATLPWRRARRADAAAVAARGRDDRAS